jgi:hypothetical protein
MQRFVKAAGNVATMVQTTPVAKWVRTLLIASALLVPTLGWTQPAAAQYGSGSGGGYPGSSGSGPDYLNYLLYTVTIESFQVIENSDQSWTVEGYAYSYAFDTAGMSIWLGGIATQRSAIVQEDGFFSCSFTLPPHMAWMVFAAAEDTYGNPYWPSEVAAFVPNY